MKEPWNDPRWERGRRLVGRGELALNGDGAVRLADGRAWTPDETSALIKFGLSYAFPNVSNYGDGLHVSVIARCFPTMANKPVNSNHKMAAYGAARDAILGTVVGVDFPQEPGGGWKTAADRASSPNMTGVAALWLTASGVDQWIERYGDQRKNVAVSMEVIYPVAQSGFAVGLKGTERTEGTEKTPAEFLEAGWEYMPMSALLTPAQMELDSMAIAAVAEKAPKDSLLRTRNFRAKRMIGGDLLGSGLVGSWKGREVYFLQGGVAGQVHYPGMGLVEQGAERRAGIETMLAEDEEAAEFARSCEEVGRAFEETAEKIRN